MSDCLRLRASLHALAEGEAREEGPLRAHAGLCPECGRALAGARRLLADLSRVSRHEVDPPAALVPAILAALPRTELSGRRRAFWTAASTGAVLLTASVVGVLAWLADAGPGDIRLPWLRELLQTASGIVARFAALLAAADVAPALPGGPRLHAGAAAAGQALALIAAGLLGAAATLGAACASARRKT